jgi:Tol biopolymer transport system component
VVLAVAILAALSAAGWLAVSRLARPSLIREGAPSWSPDGKQIVFYAERDDQPADLFVMDADGSNVRQLTHTRAAEGYPSWSPDGRLIAFEADDPTGNFDIYVMNADGSNTRRLTQDPRRDVGPAWSPDGRKIVFMSDRGGPEFDIYEMNADGSDVERLTAGQTNWFPQFSPDGTRLALHVGRDVNVFDLKTRTMHALTQDPANGMYPTWSPDGRRIAFMSWRNGRTELFTMNADGTDQRVLFSPATGSAIDPRWSPDGSRIVFVETTATEQAFDQSTPAESIICTVDVTTGEVRRLAHSK